MNASKNTFVIKLAWKRSDNTFIFQTAKELVNILKTEETNGVDFIKKLDKDLKFKRVSKKEVLHEMEADKNNFAYLKNHYYFN